MAFGTALDSNDEDKQKQQAQDGLTASPATQPVAASFGGAGGAGGAGGGTSSAAPPTASQGGGSGFVNLQRYMNNSVVDKGAKVSGAASAALDPAKASFNAAAQPLRDASASFAAPPSEADIKGAWDTRNDDALHTWANTKYDGPTSMSWTPDAGNFTQLAKLANKDTAFGAAFGPQNGTMGNSILDSAMFQADGGARAAMDKTGADSKQFLGDAQTEMNKLNEKGPAFAKQAQDIRDAVTNSLQGKLAGVNSGLDARVAAAKAANNDAQLNPNATLYGLTDATHAGSQLPTGTWRDAQNLNREGLATAADKQNFARIASILGLDPQLGQANDGYTAGYWQAPKETLQQKKSLDDTIQVQKDDKKRAQNGEQHRDHTND